MTERNVVQQIRRATRRRFSSEEKIRIVLEGLRGEFPVTELCRREGISSALYYRWSKAFLDAGKNGLVRDTKRDATASDFQIFVRAYPGPGGKWQASTSGGFGARWSPDGKELFYRYQKKLYAVVVDDSAGSLRASRPATA